MLPRPVLLAGTLGILTLSPISPRSAGVEPPAGQQIPVRFLSPAWSPDGKRLMYEANLENPRRIDLHVIALEGTVGGKLREDARQGSWSRDGRLVLFASMSDGDLDLYTISPETSEIRQLTNDSTMDYQAKWSPDGRRIAFASVAPPSPAGRPAHDIFVMNADGSGRTAITQTPQEDQSPVWSPDGRQIAFVSTRDGNWEVYVASANGGEARRLTNHPQSDTGPTFTPDGKFVVFISNRDGGRKLWRVAVDGGEPVVFLEQPAVTLAWSPDGKRIAFADQRDGSWGIFVMNADGSEARRVTPVPPPPPVANKLDRLKWLGGCWERRTATLLTLEMWMPPEGDFMLGASRTLSGGAVREFEQLRLEAKGDTVIYTALPSGQSQASFRGALPSDSGFTVENLQHDFPQRIIYRRRGADSLVARIEGPGPNGTRGIDFPMRRAACTAP